MEIFIRKEQKQPKLWSQKTSYILKTLQSFVFRVRLCPNLHDREITFSNLNNTECFQRDLILTYGSFTLRISRSICAHKYVRVPILLSQVASWLIFVWALAYLFPHLCRLQCDIGLFRKHC